MNCSTRSLWVCCALAALAYAVGCAASDSDADPPKSGTAFEGKLDKRFVGHWKVQKGTTDYTFEESGAYRLKGSASNRGQTIPIDTGGEWKATSDRLLMKDADGNVVPYTFKFDGDRRVTLGLTGSMKNEVVLQKQ